MNVMSRMSRLQGEFREVIGRAVLRLSVSGADLSYERLDAELVSMAEEAETSVEKCLALEAADTIKALRQVVEERGGYTCGMPEERVVDVE